MIGTQLPCEDAEAEAHRQREVDKAKDLEQLHDNMFS